MELARLFERRRHDGQQPNVRPQVLPLKRVPWLQDGQFRPIGLQALAGSPDHASSWRALEAGLEKHWQSSSWLTRDHWKRTGGRFQLWRGGEVEITGVPFRCPVVHEYVRPMVLTPESPASRFGPCYSASWISPAGTTRPDDRDLHDFLFLRQEGQHSHPKRSGGDVIQHDSRGHSD